MTGAYVQDRSSLSVRLAVWAISRGWRLRIGINRAANKGQRVTATVGSVTGFGRTAGEAVEMLAKGLAEREGWVDDYEVVA